MPNARPRRWQLQVRPAARPAWLALRRLAAPTSARAPQDTEGWRTGSYNNLQPNDPDTEALRHDCFNPNLTEEQVRTNHLARLRDSYLEETPQFAEQIWDDWRRNVRPRDVRRHQDMRREWAHRDALEAIRAGGPPAQGNPPPAHDGGQHAGDAGGADGPQPQAPAPREAAPWPRGAPAVPVAGDGGDRGGQQGREAYAERRPPRADAGAADQRGLGRPGGRADPLPWNAPPPPGRYAGAAAPGAPPGPGGGFGGAFDNRAPLRERHGRLDDALADNAVDHVEELAMLLEVAGLRDPHNCAEAAMRVIHMTRPEIVDWLDHDREATLSLADLIAHYDGLHGPAGMLTAVRELVIPGWQAAGDRERAIRRRALELQEVPVAPQLRGAARRDARQYSPLQHREVRQRRDDGAGVRAADYHREGAPGQQGHYREPGRGGRAADYPQGEWPEQHGYYREHGRGDRDADYPQEGGPGRQDYYREHGRGGRAADYPQEGDPGQQRRAYGGARWGDALSALSPPPPPGGTGSVARQRARYGLRAVRIGEASNPGPPRRPPPAPPQNTPPSPAPRRSSACPFLWTAKQAMDGRGTCRGVHLTHEWPRSGAATGENR